MQLRGAATAVATMAVALMSAAPASAVERISDGTFDTRTTCAAGDCTSPVWSEVGVGAQLCGPGGAPACTTFGSARSGSYHLFFQHAFIDSDDVPPGYRTLSYAEQYAPIPAAPATLAFFYSRGNGAGVETLTVKLDGRTVATPSTTGGVPYTQVSVDVSAFAGPGNHALRFEYGCINTCGGVHIDDVSLDAADVPPVEPEPDPQPEPQPAPLAPPVLCAGQVATVVGSDAAETLTGGPGDDVIASLGGNDRVKAAGGDDLVCGGAGNDQLSGKAGRDSLLGEDGSDRLRGGGGRGDRCDGGNGRDRAARSCEKVPA